MNGFFNRILTIDLTERWHKVEDIPDSVLERYLGGKGLGSYLLLRDNPPGVEPFSPQNRLIFVVGCATDVQVMGSSRYGVFTKSPLTGIYCESYAGGRLADALSRTGYDAVVLVGQSFDPVYLEVSDSGVKFHPASDLWGKTTYEAEREVLQSVGVKGARSLVIGPAGENLVRFALIENDLWRSAGRGGVGAVMGSKRVKALVFHGEARRSVARPELLLNYWRGLKARAGGDAKARNYRIYGTPGMVATVNLMGAFPTRYWSSGRFDGWQRISADALLERCQVRPRACPRCSLACGKLIEVKEGRHRGLRLEGPEYETIYAFGGLCLIDSIEEIANLNDICDRLGMDTITAGNLAAFAIEASRRGRIPERLDYGDVDGIAALLEGIARREGIGAILAEGLRFASREWGLEDIPVHVKGMEPAGYDPRVLKGMGLAYATADRGACHLRTTFYKAELSGMVNPDETAGKAELLTEYEDRMNIFDSLILCKFYQDLIPWEGLSTILLGTTGLDLSREELRQIGAGIADATRWFNIREGVKREDDTLPQRLFDQPLDEKAIREQDLERMVTEYYRFRGWDSEGIPPHHD